MQHKTAVNRALKARGADEDPALAPLAQLLRTIAEKLDAEGSDPSSRLIASYLSALKDLDRAAPAARVEHPGGTVSRLDEMRARIQAGTRKEATNGR